MSSLVNRLGGGTVRVWRGVGVMSVYDEATDTRYDLELHSLIAALEAEGFAVIDMEATDG